MNVNNGNFNDEVLKSDIPVFVDFYADWCGPCKMLEPVVQELIEEYGEKVKFVKLNIDEASDIAAQYTVVSIPTLIMFRNGTEAEKIIGYHTKEELIEALKL